jgi:hypothetical protein
MPPSSGGREAAWLARAAATARQEAPDDHGGGKISDAVLRRRLRGVVGGAVPTGVTRDQLVEVATRLNVFSADALAITTIRRQKRISWDEHIKSIDPRAQPFDDGDEWLSSPELSQRLNEHVGRDHPANMGRDALLTHCVNFNIITQTVADRVPPVRLDNKALDALLREAAADDGVLLDAFRTLANRDEKIETALNLGIITRAQALAPMLRPDKADAMALAKVSQQVTRCLGSRRMFEGVLNADAALARIRDACKEMTQLVFYGSRRLALHWRRILGEDALLLPNLDGSLLEEHVRHCFGANTINDETHDQDILQVDAAFPGVFAGASDVTKPSNLANMFKHACNVYAGSLVTHFTCESKVLQRVRKYASARLFGVHKRLDRRYADVWQGQDVVGVPEPPTEADIGCKPLLNIEIAVANGCRPRDLAALHARQREVALEIRDILGLDAPLTKAWLRKNIRNSIKFTHNLAHVIDQQRAEAARMLEELRAANPGLSPQLLQGSVHMPQGVSLVPLSGDANKFITLDATDLHHLVCGKVEKGAAASTMRRVFRQNIVKVLGKRYGHDPDYVTAKAASKKTRFFFTGTVDTDGVSFHMHFARALRKHEEKKAKDEPKEVVKKLTTPPRTMLLVDTGRVNLVKMVVMRDGKLVWVVRQRARDQRTRRRPLTIGYTNRQYRCESGLSKAAKVDKSRLQVQQVQEAALHKELSATTCKTANLGMATRHMAAQTRLARHKWWVRGGLAALQSRQRRRTARVRKERALVRFWTGVKAQVEKLAKGGPVTLVWGVAVAATGKGNIPAPTSTIFKVAKRVLCDWSVVMGCEFRTSMLTCVPGTGGSGDVSKVCVAHAARVRSQVGERKVRRRSQDRVESRLRNGMVWGLNRKRLARRHAQGKPHNVCRRQEDTKIDWVLDGHAGEDDGTKKNKKEERLAQGVALVKYVRGLRVCQDGKKTKLFDRDVNAAHNIGLLHIFDSVEGMQRPVLFRRETDVITAALVETPHEARERV